MAVSPKSFWGGGTVDPDKIWVSEYDDLGLRAEADIIRLSTRAGIPLPSALEYELWELAAALNLDLIETQQDRTVREIDEAQEKYWEETRVQREAIIARRAERRQEQQAKR